MSIEKKVKELLHRKDWTIEMLAVKIGMTRGGLSLALKNNEFKVSTLLLIAEQLEVDIKYFFGDTQKAYDQSAMALEEKLLIAQKEIEYQKKIIELYEKNERLKNNPDAVSGQKLTHKGKE